MTHLIVSGINHRTAGIGVRERFAVAHDNLKDALALLSRNPHVLEAVILSTCNRTEVYAVVGNVPEGFRAIEGLYSSREPGREIPAARPNFKLMNDDVALHLFRVASGLNSLILGESQIVAQIKEAHCCAREAGTLGPVLNRLFQSALSCGKRVRSNTGIGRLAVSVASAAVEFGLRHLGNLTGKVVVVVGTGRMAQICLKLLSSRFHPGRLVSVNRSTDGSFESSLKLKETADSFGSWGDRHRLVAAADLVIVASSSPEYLFGRETLSKLLSGTGKSVVIIDISVPRSVDPSIGGLKEVRLFHTDDLGHAQPDPIERDALIARAEEIVFAELDQFNQWHQALPVVPAIVEWRRKIETMRAEQVARTRLSLDASGNISAERSLENLSRAIINHVLHEPTVRLKQACRAGESRQVSEALQMIFQIDPTWRSRPLL